MRCGLRRGDAPGAGGGLRDVADRAARQRQVRGRAAHWPCATGVALIVIDNLDEIERLERLIGEGVLEDRGLAAGAPARHARTSQGDTHENDLHRPGGLEVRFRDGRPRGCDRACAGRHGVARWRGCTRTSARSCSIWSPSWREVGGAAPTLAPFPHLGSRAADSGVAYHCRASDRRRSRSTSGRHAGGRRARAPGRTSAC